MNQQQLIKQQNIEAIVDLNKTSSSSTTSTTTSSSSPTSMNNEHQLQQNTFFSPLSLKSTSSTNSTNNNVKHHHHQQQTISSHHPKRRTPRNAEEFLEAAGIDSDYFVNKGYYVGSMYNLNQIQATTGSVDAPQKKGIPQQNESKKQLQPVHRSLSLIKRKNSLTETPSMSLANLNVFNQEYNKEASSSKKYTELSLFNEYFIDKTYKYVNNNREDKKEEEQRDIDVDDEVRNVYVNATNKVEAAAKSSSIVYKPTTVNGNKIIHNSSKNRFFFYK